MTIRTQDGRARVVRGRIHPDELWAAVLLAAALGLVVGFLLGQAL